MDSFSDIVDTIKEYLSESDEFKDVIFLISSPALKVPNPMDKIHVSLGIKKIEISQGAFSGYLGLLEENELYGDLNDIDVSMKIYVPMNMDGENCYDIFSKTYGVLLEKDNTFNIQSIKCEKIEFDNKFSAYTMECEIKISMLIGHDGMEF
ncbi:MAG: hypothetical protein IJ758_02015 [Clostridia bacterium]|nr:hypothetical protein [Clostridia bacterium]